MKVKVSKNTFGAQHMVAISAKPNAQNVTKIFLDMSFTPKRNAEM